MLTWIKKRVQFKLLGHVHWISNNICTYTSDAQGDHNISFQMPEILLFNIFKEQTYMFVFSIAFFLIHAL